MQSSSLFTVTKGRQLYNRLSLNTQLLLFVTVPLFVFFLVTGRALGLVEEIGEAIRGQANIILLLLDIVTLLAVVVCIIYVSRDLNPTTAVVTQTVNHPCIKEVVLPAHIDEAYLPQSVKDERAREDYLREVAQQEELARQSVKRSNSAFSAMMGFRQPSAPAPAPPPYEGEAQQAIQDELLRQFAIEREKVEAYDRKVMAAEQEARRKQFEDALNSNFSVGIDVQDLEDIDEVLRLHNERNGKAADNADVPSAEDTDTQDEQQ